MYHTTPQLRACGPWLGALRRHRGVTGAFVAGRMGITSALLHKMESSQSAAWTEARATAHLQAMQIVNPDSVAQFLADPQALGCQMLPGDVVAELSANQPNPEQNELPT